MKWYQPQKMLNYIYTRTGGSGFSSTDELNISTENDLTWKDKGVLTKFNQWEFFEDDDDAKASNLA